MSSSPPVPISAPSSRTCCATTSIVFQVHASRYTNPDQLPPGAVLVVGSGASGAQIAEELLRAGRRVYLSVGRHSRLPRRYRGRDLIWWLSAMGLDQTTAEQRGPSRLLPVISGAYGGHTIDFRHFAADGMTLLGRIEAAHDGVIDIAPDLAESLANGDATYTTFLDMVDAHVERLRTGSAGRPRRPRGAAGPALRHRTAAAPRPRRRRDRRGDLGHRLRRRFRLDRRAGAGWRAANRFTATASADVPGLYFLGLQWLSRMNSSFLSGVGDDAAVLADHIAARG